MPLRSPQGADQPPAGSVGVGVQLLGLLEGNQLKAFAGLFLPTEYSSVRTRIREDFLLLLVVFFFLRLSIGLVYHCSKGHELHFTLLKRPLMKTTDLPVRHLRIK